MDLIELTPDYEVTEFDCGDEQLNKFLFEDAKPSLALRVANRELNNHNTAKKNGYFLGHSDNIITPPISLSGARLQER